MWIVCAAVVLVHAIYEPPVSHFIGTCHDLSTHDVNGAHNVKMNEPYRYMIQRSASQDLQHRPMNSSQHRQLLMMRPCLLLLVWPSSTLGMPRCSRAQFVCGLVGSCCPWSVHASTQQTELVNLYDGAASSYDALDGGILADTLGLGRLRREQLL